MGIFSKTQIDLSKIKGPYALLAAFLLVFEGLVGFWLFQAESTYERIITGSIMAVIFIVFIIAVVDIATKRAGEASKPAAPEGPSTEVTIEFCDRKEDVEKKVTDLLKETKESLYYYGGTGFIGDYQHWREELGKKLKDEKIKIVRLIDLKTPKEIKEVLKTMKEEESINSDINKYIKWLELHSDNLKIRIKNNTFYNFDGAPLWKYGLNHLIFDKRHVAIIFLSYGEIRNAIFIRDNPDIAKAIVKSIDWVVEVLGLKPITSEELEKISGRRG